MTGKPHPLALRPESIPQALQMTGSWVLWRYEQRKGKWTKPPRALRGGNAKTNDASTWASFREVMGAAAGADGVGVVLTEDLVGVDLDHVLNPETGEVEPWAAEVMERFRGCYVERSPGGDGVHVFCRGIARRSGKGGPGNRLEVYDKTSPRYLTVTGHRLGDGDVIEAQAALDWLHATHMQKEPQQGGQMALAPAAAPPVAVSDDEVIRRASQASNGAKFLRLMAGQADGDASSNDAALVAMLAFWTQDAAQIDRIFRRSGLMREKWDRPTAGSTYGAITIDKILKMGGERFGHRGAVGGQGQAIADDDAGDDADHHRNPPAPDPACLYGLVGEIAEAASATTEANPFAVALSSLVYLGCCVGRGPYLPVGNVYHHARLYGLHVGRSSRGKKGEALSLLHRVDRALRESHPDLAPQVHRGGLSSREGLIYLIHDGFMEGKNEVAPIHDKRLWVIESEFANVLHQTKRDGNTLSAALRDCWDGISLKPATKSARISTTDPHVALSAAVTPSELIALIEAKELTNGFANRFLTVFSERTRLVPIPESTPQKEVDRLAGRVARVLKFACADRWVDRDSMRMELSPEAREMYARLYVGELNRADFGPLVNALLERRAPTLLRISMILALTDESTVIEPRHMSAALAWIRYWTDSVRFIFSTGAEELAQRQVSAAADRIVKFLGERGRQSRSAISRDCFHGKLSKGRLDAALDELLQSTPPAVVVEVEPRTDGPGSPTKFYRITAKSAKSQKCESGQGLSDDFGVSEVSEVSEVRGDSEVSHRPDFSTLRTLRRGENGPQTRASAHASHTSLNSPKKSGVDDTEVFQ